jgi:hypothetical protein
MKTLLLIIVIIFNSAIAYCDKPKPYLSKDARTGELLYIEPVTVKATNGNYVIIWFTYRFKK